jgi:large subunit ribosomal protein L24
MALRIRKGDLVQVIAGADRGKQGRVTAVDVARGRVRVEKVRMHKRHFKPGRKAARTGGIIEQEGYIDASNVLLVDPKTGKPARLRVRVEDGRRVRAFAKSGDSVPAPAQV